MTDKQYKSYTLRNYKNIKQLVNLSAQDIRSIEVVGNVLPFKTNNYVIDELIDWNNYKDDPIFHLTFPQKEMLTDEHYKIVEKAIDNNASAEELFQICHEIRKHLNPNPGGQQCLNVPMHKGEMMSGVQHKYRETVLFFPSAGQTCHAYCTFCFRWPQFIGGKRSKFAGKESQDLAKQNDQKQK